MHLLTVSALVFDVVLIPNRFVTRVFTGAELKEKVGDDEKRFTACRGESPVVGLSPRVDLLNHGAS
jgi:hypothetical protein